MAPPGLRIALLPTSLHQARASRGPIRAWRQCRWNKRDILAVVVNRNESEVLLSPICRREISNWKVSPQNDPRPGARGLSPRGGVGLDLKSRL
jgi:hypothetical protein